MDKTLPKKETGPLSPGQQKTKLLAERKALLAKLEENTKKLNALRDVIAE